MTSVCTCTFHPSGIRFFLLGEFKPVTLGLSYFVSFLLILSCFIFLLIFYLFRFYFLFARCPFSPFFPKNKLKSVKIYWFWRINLENRYFFYSRSRFLVYDVWCYVLWTACRSFHSGAHDYAYSSLNIDIYILFNNADLLEKHPRSAVIPCCW